MKTKRVLGFFLVFAGLFIILTGKAITGAVIGFQPKNYLGLLGILICLTGIFLITASTREWDKYRVNLVLREYESGQLNPVQAALKINDRLYPEGLKITGIDYRGGKINGTIKTPEQFIPFRVNDPDKARDLALAFYEMALINDTGNRKNCELHIGKNASTKHHKSGLQSLLESFEGKYQKDLELAKSR